MNEQYIEVVEVIRYQIKNNRAVDPDNVEQLIEYVEMLEKALTHYVESTHFNVWTKEVEPNWTVARKALGMEEPSESTWYYHDNYGTLRLR